MADFYWYLNHATGECEMKNAKTTAKSLLLPQLTESQVESNTKKAVIRYFSQSQLEQRAVAKVIKIIMIQTLFRVKLLKAGQILRIKC